MTSATTRRFLRVWLATASVLFGVGVLWALATPVGAAPDEPTQVVKAAAVVRGELGGASVRGAPAAYVRVTVPASFAGDAGLASCYAGRPTVPAGCAPHLSTSSRPVEATTYVGHYPPLYYLLVGVPTLLWQGDAAVLGVRVVSALWGALLLGLAVAIAAAWSRSRLLVPALAVAVTPMAVFLIAVVNPSGLEISAAVAAWTGAIVLVLDHRHRPPPALVTATATAAVVLVLCRGLSPLWAAVVGVAAVLLAPGAVPTLWRHRRVRRAAVLVTAVAGAATVFIVAAHTLSVLPVGRPVTRHASDLAVLAQTLGDTGTIARQAIGTFGWLDTPSPFAVLAGWAVVTGFVVVAGLAFSSRRHALVLVLVMAVALVLPLALIASQARHDGIVWQARDGLPLYVGVPILAGAIAGRGRERTMAVVLGAVSAPALRQAVARTNAVVIAVAAAGQGIDFGWALRRYTVGLGPALAPWTAVRGGWQPPLPSVVLLLLGAGAVAAYGWWMVQVAGSVSSGALVGNRISVGPPTTSVSLHQAEALLDRIFPTVGSSDVGPPPFPGPRAGGSMVGERSVARRR